MEYEVISIWDDEMDEQVETDERQIYIDEEVETFEIDEIQINFDDMDEQYLEIDETQVTFEDGKTRIPYIETDEMQKIIDEEGQTDEVYDDMVEIDIWIEGQYDYSDEIDILDEIYILVQENEIYEMLVFMQIQ